MPLVEWLPSVPQTRLVKESKDFSTRTIPASFIVVHTTGSGVIAQAQNAGKTKPEEIARFACEFYARSGNNVSTHLLVDWEGKVWQILPLTVDGWHSGWDPKLRELYKSSEWQKWSRPVNGVLEQKAPEGNYSLWKSLFPGKKSPADLLPAGASSPNKGSISIDLLARPYKQTWTTEQLSALHKTIKEVSDMMGSKAVYPHSYLDPVTRMTQKVGSKIIEKAWDPSDWESIKPVL
jgi:hypothetical protein